MYVCVRSLSLLTNREFKGRYSLRERERGRGDPEEMKGNGGGGGSAADNGRGNKVERKTVERNRRIRMKSLCFKLSSLVPKEEDLLLSKDALSQHDHLDQAAAYIKKLRERIERLKLRRRYAAGGGSGDRPDENAGVELGFPVIEVRYQDPILEVVLITDAKKKFVFYKVIAALEEEGAEVTNASFSVVDDKIYYTFHSQAMSSRIGLEASRVSERLKELMQC